MTRFSPSNRNWLSPWPNLSQTLGGMCCQDGRKIRPRKIRFLQANIRRRNELPVRVLYSAQNDPQYMLARSPTSIPVFMVYKTPRSGSTPSIYGKTRLETCVQAFN